MAAALVEEGWARRVLVAKSAPNPFTTDKILPPPHEVNRGILVNRGVPADNVIILPGAAETTFDEAQALATFLKDRPGARVIVVTSDYHSRRSRWIFQRTLAGRSDVLSFVSAPTDYVDMDQWWREQWGMKIVPVEYLKLAFYLVRYGYFLRWLAACGFLAVVAFWIRRRQAVFHQ